MSPMFSSKTAELLAAGRHPRRTSSRLSVTLKSPVTGDMDDAEGDDKPRRSPARNSMNLGVRNQPLTDEALLEAADKADEDKLASTSKARPRGLGRTKSNVGVGWYNETEVLETMHEVFHADSYSGFILIGYQQDNLTLELQACGEGGIAQCVDFLEDDQQQYIMLRLTVDVETKKTRDVLITWQGPKVGIILRGRFGEHKNTIESVLQPVHAHLTAKVRANLNDATILKRSDPLSGSHEL